MGSNVWKLILGLAAVTVLLGPALSTLYSSRGTSTTSTPSNPPLPPPTVTRKFLQTRQELLAKYGEPTTTGPSKITPGEHLKFRSGTLDVDADLADNACHRLFYKLPQYWTDAQIEAALQKNGTGWQALLSETAFMPTVLRFVDYTSKEGHRARYSAPSFGLEIWSCQFVQQAQVQQELKARKAAEIPKF